MSLLKLTPMCHDASVHALPTVHAHPPVLSTPAPTTPPPTLVTMPPHPRDPKLRPGHHLQRPHPGVAVVLATGTYLTSGLVQVQPLTVVVRQQFETLRSTTCPPGDLFGHFVLQFAHTAGGHIGKTCFVVFLCCCK